jgi:hypothetical protein
VIRRRVVVWSRDAAAPRDSPRFFWWLPRILCVWLNRSTKLWRRRGPHYSESRMRRDTIVGKKLLDRFVLFTVLRST